MSILSLLLVTLGSGCSSRDFNQNLGAIVKPYRFHTLSWEIKTVFGSLKHTFRNAPEDEKRLVLDYFDTVSRVKELRSEMNAANGRNQSVDTTTLSNELSKLQEQIITSQGVAEDILERQLRATLIDLGIFNPFESALKLKFSFPPLDFTLDRLPHLLVISPRDRIENTRSVSLRQDIAVEDMDKIESAVDKLGVSSLVVNLGGFSGTYPTMVTNEATLRFTLDAAAEEWLHQYLAFKPLGFRYLLSLTGLQRSYEIATMNETAASILGKEIGGIVVQKYYSGSQNEEPEKDRDAFNTDMREIRKTVDALLADGKIEEAEKFMADKRQELAARGHYIRKLNQAYFAFYGAYADRPDSISPIGAEMKVLRARSASLKDFLERVAAMKSRQDLIESLK